MVRFRILQQAMQQRQQQKQQEMMRQRMMQRQQGPPPLGPVDLSKEDAGDESGCMPTVEAWPTRLSLSPGLKLVGSIFRGPRWP